MHTRLKNTAPGSALAAISILLLTGSGNSTIQDLHWPARVEQGVTSAFGDWRPGHVHAGIDVKTWGRVGVPMLAVGDGHIQRVRTSPWGYGKALYLQLADGRVAVYGHLDRFTPELDDRVVDQQFIDLTYSVDIWFAPDEFPVSRGDVIAYSGITGTSSPHLHFELRDEFNRPINPLTAGLQITDTIPPVVSYILVRPVGPASRLEGDVRVRRFGLRSAGGRSYRLRGRPEVSGTTVLAVSTYDMMDGVWNRFGPYRLTLAIDSEERFATTYDRFSYAESGQVGLDRDYRWLVREGSRAHTLYRQKGNQLTFYEPYEVGDGYLTLSPGTHDLQITVGDALGNETTVTGEILVNSAPVVNWVREGNGTVARARRSDTGAVTDGRSIPVPQGRVTDPDGDAVTLTIETLAHGDRGNAPDSGSQTSEAAGPGEPRWTTLPPSAVNRAGEIFTLAPAILDSLLLTGPLSVRVRGRDVWGSESVSNPVMLSATHFGPAGEDGRRADSGELEMNVERYESFLILTARVSDPLPGRILFTVRQGELDAVLLRGAPEESDIYRAVYPLRLTGREDVTITADWQNVSGARVEVSAVRRVVSLPADGSARFYSEATGLTVSFGPGAVYSDAWFEQVGTETAISNDEQGLVPLSSVTLLGPEDILFRGQGEVSIPLGTLPGGVDARQVGLYTRGEREESDEGEGPRWFWLGGEMRGETLRATIGGLGPLAAMADTTRPGITLISPRDGSTLRSGRPQIAYEIDDNATGFSDEQQLVLRLNGTLLIAQYDAQRDRLIYTPRDPLPSGDYFLTLEAIDGAGNTARLNSRFTVR